jgi:hypothetical protein
MKVNNLFEAFSKYGDGSVKKGIGIIFADHGGEIDIDDLDTLEIFVDLPSFLTRVANLYLDFIDEDLDLADLHSDPEIQAKIRKVTKKKAPLDPLTFTSLAQFNKLKRWNAFLETCWIESRF